MTPPPPNPAGKNLPRYMTIILRTPSPAPPPPNSQYSIPRTHRGSYMSAHILLNLLNEVGKAIRCETLSSIVSVFPNKFNEFNNTGARMQDFIYHMTLKTHFISKFCFKRHDFAIRKRDVFMDVNA